MRKVFLSSLFLIAILSGCVSVEYFESRPTGPAVSVSFETPTPVPSPSVTKSFPDQNLISIEHPEIVTSIRFSVTYNCGPSASQATFEGFEKILLLPSGTVWFDSPVPFGWYSYTLNCRFGEKDYSKKYQIFFSRK